MELKESHTVELKKSLSQLDDALKSVCAFLNHKGGISRQDYIKINNVSHTTAHKELKEMVNKRILRKISGGKYRRYMLTQG